MKLHFLQFYPADYMRDTRALSLAAKGGWVDVICMLHGCSTRGTMKLPAVGWARVMGASVDQAVAVIDELQLMGVCDVIREGNGDVTISSRRMLRERISKEQTRLRVANHRRNALSAAVGNADVTDKKLEARSYKLETKNTEKAEGASASPPVLPDSLKSEAFIVKWAEYETYRRQTKLRALKFASVQKKWAEMSTWGVDAAIAAIDTTIRNGWQGIFEPKQGGYSQSKANPVTDGQRAAKAHEYTY